MSELQPLSSPELPPSESSEMLPSTASNSNQPLEDSGLEGVSTSVRLLLKLIEDHNVASTRSHDDRMTQRVATMVMILDDVKSQIQKSQQSPRRTEFKRCHSDLRSTHSQTPRSPKAMALPPMPEDTYKLQKELNASLAAQKSLQMMCRSLGKEKEIMAAELAKKAQELNAMEELVNDLKAQNESLLHKLQSLQKEKESGGGGEECQGSSLALQDRNKTLSEQLLKSLDAYRSLKRRYKELQKENIEVVDALKKVEENVEHGFLGLNRLKGASSRSEVKSLKLEEEIPALEGLFDGIKMKISKYVERKESR